MQPQVDQRTLHLHQHCSHTETVALSSCAFITQKNTGREDKQWWISTTAAHLWPLWTNLHRWGWRKMKLFYELCLISQSQPHSELVVVASSLLSIQDAVASSSFFQRHQTLTSCWSDTAVDSSPSLIHLPSGDDILPKCMKKMSRTWGLSLGRAGPQLSSVLSDDDVTSSDLRNVKWGHEYMKHHRNCTKSRPVSLTPKRSHLIGSED